MTTPEQFKEITRDFQRAAQELEEEIRARRFAGFRAGAIVAAIIGFTALAVVFLLR